MEEFNLKQIFNIFWKRRIAIVIIMILTISIGAVYSFLTAKPVYKSSAKLLLIPINNKITSNGIEYIGTLNKEDVLLNSKLIDSYDEILKSKDILKRVIEELGIENLSENALRDSVFIELVTDTGIINITVFSKNPEQAQILADKLTEIFIEEVANTFIENNVEIINKAQLNTTPINVDHKRDIIVSAFIGIILVCGYVLVRYLWESSKEISE